MPSPQPNESKANPKIIKDAKESVTRQLDSYAAQRQLLQDGRVDAAMAPEQLAKMRQELETALENYASLAKGLPVDLDNWQKCILEATRTAIWTTADTQLANWDRLQDLVHHLPSGATPEDAARLRSHQARAVHMDRLEMSRRLGRDIVDITEEEFAEEAIRNHNAIMSQLRMDPGREAKSS